MITLVSSPKQHLRKDMQHSASTMWMAKYKEQPLRKQTLEKSMVFIPLMNKNKVSYTPLQNVWHGSKSVVTFGLIKILTYPC
jgi:hypothetical protein